MVPYVDYCFIYQGQGFICQATETFAGPEKTTDRVGFPLICASRLTFILAFRAETLFCTWYVRESPLGWLRSDKEHPGIAFFGFCFNNFIW